MGLGNAAGATGDRWYADSGEATGVTKPRGSGETGADRLEPPDAVGGRIGEKGAGIADDLDGDQVMQMARFEEFKNELSCSA